MSNLPDFWRTGFSRDLGRVNRFLDHFFDDSLAPRRGQNDLTAWSPSCELSEDKDHYVAKFEIPGVNKDQIKLELHDNQLTVRAERKSEMKDEKKHYSEFSYGSYVRSFSLPTPVNSEKVEATYENGVLTVKMNKSTQSGRQITVR